MLHVNVPAFLCCWSTLKQYFSPEFYCPTVIKLFILIYSWQENRSFACSHTGPSLALWLVSGQYTSFKDVIVSDLLSLATLVGHHTSKLTVLVLVTIRKPLELNRPGMFPTSSQTKGATASEWRVTVYPVLSCRTSACRETHSSITTINTSINVMKSATLSTDFLFFMSHLVAWQFSPN